MISLQNESWMKFEFNFKIKARCRNVTQAFSRDKFRTNKLENMFASIQCVKSKSSGD